ncbi:MAG: hypothetical protein MK081_08895 [Flavobacteriales bacterium]|nr:hypothetical protein [Flavobacteriales bacterium]
MFDTTLYKTTWDTTGNITTRLEIKQGYYQNIDWERTNNIKTRWKDDWTRGLSNVYGYRHYYDTLGRMTFSESISGDVSVPMSDVTWSMLDSAEGIISSQSRYFYGPFGLDSIQNRFSKTYPWNTSTEYKYDDNGNLLREVWYVSGQEDRITTCSYDDLGRLVSRIDSALLPPSNLFWENGFRSIELRFFIGGRLTVMSNSELLAKESRTWFDDDSVEVVIDLYGDEYYDPSDTADVHYIEFTNSKNQRDIKWINYYGEPQGPEPFDPRRTRDDWIPSPGAIRTGEFSKGDRRRLIWVYE